MSWLADGALWIALAATTGSVLYLHYRLRHLGADLAAYRAALAESQAALDAAGRALGLLINEGQAVAFTLADEIERANAAATGETARRRASRPPPPAANETSPTVSAHARIRAFVPTRVAGARVAQTA